MRAAKFCMAELEQLDAQMTKLIAVSARGAPPPRMGAVSARRLARSRDAGVPRENTAPAARRTPLACSRREWIAALKNAARGRPRRRIEERKRDLRRVHRRARESARAKTRRARTRGGGDGRSPPRESAFARTCFATRRPRDQTAPPTPFAPSVFLRRRRIPGSLGDGPSTTSLRPRFFADLARKRAVAFEFRERRAATRRRALETKVSADDGDVETFGSWGIW